MHISRDCTRALLIVNPAAGRMQKTPAASLSSALSQEGLEVIAVTPQSMKEAAAALRRAAAETGRPIDRVVVAGGDGTINAILPALLEALPQRAPARPLSLAVIPVGSANVLAREMGIPRSIEAAAAIAAKGALRKIDLGLFNGRPFVLMAGMGFDGAAVAAIRAEHKKRLGAAEYIAQGLRLLLSYAPHKFEITCGNQSVIRQAWQVVAANASTYTYHWKVAPQARIDDGKINLCVFSHHGAPSRIRQILAVLLGRARWAPVEYYTEEKIALRVEPAAAAQLDGDAAGVHGEATIEVRPAAIELLAPPGEKRAS